MVNRFSSPLILLSLLLLLFSSFISGDPDIVVKIVYDDLAKNKKCQLAVLKNGSFKNLDKKYKIVSFDFYVLNHRGETKWYKTLDRAKVDLNPYEDLEITRGDLIVIENIVLINNKTGEEMEVNRITERYLVK